MVCRKRVTTKNMENFPYCLSRNNTKVLGGLHKIDILELIVSDLSDLFYQPSNCYPMKVKDWITPRLSSPIVNRLPQGSGSPLQSASVIFLFRVEPHSGNPRGSAYRLCRLHGRARAVPPLSCCDTPMLVSLLTATLFLRNCGTTLIQVRS